MGWGGSVMPRNTLLVAIVLGGAVVGATLLEAGGDGVERKRLFVPETRVPEAPGQESGQNAAHGFSPYVDAHGVISMPEGYRQNWAHMGTAVVPDDERTGFHDVYTQKSTLEAYRVTGEFPDGAVLVKEVRSVESTTLTTGRTKWAGEPDHWFVMVKDRTGRFPDSPIWGEGWGWALFEARDPEVNVTADFRVGCMGCHVPARADDWVYVDLYPTLRKRR